MAWLRDVRIDKLQEVPEKIAKKLGPNFLDRQVTIAFGRDQPILVEFAHVIFATDEEAITANTGLRALLAARRAAKSDAAARWIKTKYLLLLTRAKKGLLSWKDIAEVGWHSPSKGPIRVESIPCIYHQTNHSPDRTLCAPRPPTPLWASKRRCSRN